MLDFQQKRKVKSFIYSRVTIGILFLLVLYTLYSTFRVYQKQKESEFFKEVAERKVLELEERDKEIRLKISDLETEQGLEREIRNKFNVALADENMVIILDEEEATNTPKINSKSLWQKILNIFY